MPTLNANITGNAATASLAALATALATPRNLNGVPFDGTDDVAIPASAASLIGPTLAAEVQYSSLVALGTLLALNVSGTGTFTGTVNFSQSARTLSAFATAGSGALLNGYALQMATLGTSLNIATTAQLGDKVSIGYYDTGAAAWRSALDVAATNGFATLNLLSAGGTVAVGGALTVTGALTPTGGIAGNVNFTASSRTLALTGTGGSGSLLDGIALQVTTAGKALNLATGSNLGDRVTIVYRNTGTAAWAEALGVQATNGAATLALLAAGGTLAIGATSVTSAGGLLSSSPSAGIGYGTGAGGTVTQATSKATGVTLSKVTGQITMNAAALAAGAVVSFVLTNTAIAATDKLFVTHDSGGTAGAYQFTAQCATGSATITVRNLSGGSLSEAIVLGLTLIKGATS